MHRNAKSCLAIIIVVVGFQSTMGWAQEPASVMQLPREIEHGVARPLDPSQMLAQNETPSLIDRLRAIRGAVASEYGEEDNTSLATAPAAPVASATAEARADADGTRVSALPSVLIRRSRRAEAGTAQTVTDVPAPTTTTVVEPETTELPAEPAVQETETPAVETLSSRRSSRRTQSQVTTSSSPMTFHSSSYSGGEQLALASQGPVMRVEMAGPDTIAVGKQAPYRIRLINQGDAVAKQVVVNIFVPDAARVGTHQTRLGTVQKKQANSGTQHLVWELDQVPARSQHDLSLSLEPVKNRPIELQVDWQFQPQSFSGKIAVLQPQLAIDIDGPAEARFGEKRVFKIRVSNPGNGAAEGVKIDLRATGVSSQPNQLGTLGAGETRELEVELTARQAGVMQILATASGDGQLKAETRHDVQVRRPELAVQIEAPGLLYAGTVASYQVRIANRGDADAKDVILHFDLPAGVKDGIGIDNKPLTNEQPKWRLGDLASGIERVFTLKLNLTSSGKNLLTVRAQDSADLSASDTATTTVEAIADLKLTVNDPKGPIPVGKDVAYEITIVNRGSKEARDVGVVAQFSDGIEPSGASGQRSEIVPGQVIFDAIQSVPAGAEVTLRITAQAHKSGNHRFRAELTCGDPETKLVSEESTRFYGDAAASESATNAASRPSDSGPTPARR
jgi:hypothetical protein